MYDKEYARTSKMCYESLAPRREREADVMYEWQTGGKRNGTWQTTAGIIYHNSNGSSTTWERIDSARQVAVQADVE
jgi:hypothetical protein